MFSLSCRTSLNINSLCFAADITPTYTSSHVKQLKRDSCRVQLKRNIFLHIRHFLLRESLRLLTNLFIYSLLADAASSSDFRRMKELMNYYLLRTWNRTVWVKQERIHAHEWMRKPISAPLYFHHMRSFQTDVCHVVTISRDLLTSQNFAVGLTGQRARLFCS